MYLDIRIERKLFRTFFNNISFLEISLKNQPSNRTVFVFVSDTALFCVVIILQCYRISCSEDGKNSRSDEFLNIKVSLYFQRVEPQQSPTKYMEKAIGTPPANPVEVNKSSENGRVSSIVNAINQNSANSSMRGRIPKSSSKDDLLSKEQSPDSALQEALNSSSNSVS